MKNLLFTITIATILTSCGSDTERIRAEQQRDELQKQLEEVKFGAPNLLTDAKKFMESGDLETSKSKLNELISRHSERPEAAEARTLLYRLEEQETWNNAQNSQELYITKNYLDKYPNGNFVNAAKARINFLPATPYGILEMLKRYNIDTVGKDCVIVGRSNIVGTPLSILLSRKGWDATVTLAHSRTKDLKAICLRADILVAAIGVAHFIKADMVKEGAVVIDVGMNRIEDATKKSGSRLVGDVDFDNVAPKCSYITPVPGGVGQMTVTSLMLNTLKAAMLIRS